MQYVTSVSGIRMTSICYWSGIQKRDETLWFFFSRSAVFSSGEINRWAYGESLADPHAPLLHEPRAFYSVGGTTGNKLVIVPRKSARPDITFVPYWHHLHLFSLFPLFFLSILLGCLINFIILVFVSCSRLDSELPKPAVTLLNDWPSSVLSPLVCFFYLDVESL